MSAQCVTRIDHERQIVATAHVAEQQGQCIGRIDCSPMPLPLQRLFTADEEIVSTQGFRLLDAVADHIATLHLRGICEDGHEVALTDVQIYPSPKTVSFQVVRGGSPYTAPNTCSEGGCQGLLTHVQGVRYATRRFLIERGKTILGGCAPL
jgi:hypothetical protein